MAMYIDDGQIAHARNPQRGVAVTAVDYSPWNMMGTAARYSAARHHPGTATQDESLGAVRSQGPQPACPPRRPADWTMHGTRSKWPAEGHMGDGSRP